MALGPWHFVICTKHESGFFAMYLTHRQGKEYKNEEKRNRM